MRGLLMLLGVTLSLAGPAQAADSWGRRAANLTVAEYLDTWYKFEFGVHFSHDGVRDANRVSFQPTADPNTATVVVIQTWRDNLVSYRQLWREMRGYATEVHKRMDASLKRAEIADRWRPAGGGPQLVIRHVSYDRPHETLGVTLGAETLVEPDDIKRGEELAKARGLAWNW